MPSRGERLGGVLDGYGNFLRQKNLAPAKQQLLLIRRVREFLLFARQRTGYSFEQTLDLFLAEVGGRVGVKPWQIQQAADAVRIYRYQYRGAGKRAGADGKTKAFPDEATMLERLRELNAKAHSPLDDL